MAELLTPEQYKRNYALFRTGHFTSPRTQSIHKLCIPRYAIYHFLGLDGVTSGPTISDPLLRTVPGIVYVDSVRVQDSHLGSPIKKPGMDPNTLLNEYRRRNRVLRPLKDLARLENDARVLPVINYSFLSQMYRYPVNYRSGYYHWFNVVSQLVVTINEQCSVSNRQHFIELDLPDILPGLTTIREFNGSATPSAVMGKLRTDGDLLIADLFKWAGKNRHLSVWAKLLPEHYAKVNFIVRRNGVWTVLNLGWLNSFRKDPALDQVNGLEPNAFDLRVLKLIHTLHQAGSPLETPTVDEVNDASIVGGEVLEDDLDTLSLVMDEEGTVYDDTDTTSSDALIKDLEKELEVLDTLRENSLHSETVDDEGNSIEPAGVDVGLLQRLAPSKDGSAIVDKADALAAGGMLSAADHRRLVRVGGVAATLANPYGGEGTLEEAMTVTEEDIAITADVLNDDTCILDPGISRTTVDVMDRQYIRKVLKKDILRCVTSMQRAPIAITGYTVERETDAVNDLEIHTVKITPATGKPSTIRFQVPVIQENGTFKYNNNVMTMRKQRVDLPIRKISPTRVALSSYYGKLFIERSDKNRYNYQSWFIKQLTVRCMDPSDELISNGIISKVAIYTVELPLMYTTVAESIAGFTVGQLEFCFDYSIRLSKYDYTETERSLETKGWVLCGRGPVGALVMDPKGVVYQSSGNELLDIGTLEFILGVDTSTAPVSCIDVKIYAKLLPVGVALAYLLGLDNLLDVLKVTPRRVLVGERLQLSSDEYAIRFKNESLVLSRSDVRSSLILSGFNTYHAQLRNYDIGLFNSTDVYAAVLDKAGVGSRYLRELDTMNTLFIDPITLDLLEWMKEPTTIPELLVRAVDLLSTAYTPARREDSSRRVEGLERIRGYERIAGTVYEVLSKAVRSYSARAATGRSQVTINPNDITRLIIKDPTTSNVNNINPIHSLREREVVTFGGRGGRSRRAMVASARLFTEEDKGFISEATVDSGDVAIITYLSPNSNLTSVRGTYRMYNEKTDGLSTVMSTAALLSPMSDGDD